jgi:2-polyprenyl-3-methyl-5-hydroxy-6-metoxy-1,4-benzoquinol methylase
MIGPSAVLERGCALRRPCPLCDFSQARAAWTEDGYRYVRCSRCRVLYSDVSRAEYESKQHNAWHEQEPGSDLLAFYGTARERVHERFLDRFTPDGECRLLDVGCGLGFFVSRALARGWDAFGCDTSAAWVDRARELVGGERVFFGDLGDALKGQAQFDLITAWDVLEHIFDPLPFLDAMGHLLKPEGRLFIRTPNETWVYPTYAVRRALLGDHVELGPLNHVVYYRAATLRRALRVCGLTPISWPGLPPPQVGYANRRPAEGGRTTVVTRVKNGHAWAARKLGEASGGSIVLGADLDVLATRSAPRGHSPAEADQSQ